MILEPCKSRAAAISALLAVPVRKHLCDGTIFPGLVELYTAV